jgi:hypothetical protein
MSRRFPPSCATFWAASLRRACRLTRKDRDPPQWQMLLPGRRWQVAGLAVVLLGAAGICRADQWKDSLHWLGVGSWQMYEKDGEAFLSPEQRKSGKLTNDKAQMWRANAPTIKSASGKFLASDPDGHNPSVQLVSEQGPHAEWVFEVVSTLRPTPADKVKPTRADTVLGPSGFTFRAKIAEGPFKDWYLHAEQPAGDHKPPRRPLKLVRDVQKATVFTFIEELHYINNHRS